MDLTRFVGLFPMSFAGAPKNGKLKVSWLGIATSTFLLSLLLSVNLINILNEEFLTVLSVDSKIFRASWIPSVICENLALLCLFALQLSKRQNILKFLKEIALVDEHVSTETLLDLILI